MTTKGNEIYRSPTGNGFIVRQEVVAFDQTTNECYKTTADHASLYVPLGMSKSDAWRMLNGWLAFYDDEELIIRAWDELNELFRSPPPQLPTPVKEDDKNMN